MPHSSKPQPAKTRVDNTTALATHLGLSRWTVSRVLNNHPGIREETRQRVWQAMAELGFTPNPMARGLRGSRTGLIGVCFQEVESPILARKIAVLQNLLRGEGYRALLEFTGGDPAYEEETIRHFLSLKCDGIILAASTLPPGSPLHEILRQGKPPVIALDPVMPLPYPQVVLNRELGMQLCLEHLYELGHRRFAFLGFDESVAYGAVRLEAVRKFARQRKLSLKNDCPILRVAGRTAHNYDYGQMLATQYLALENPPPAILALNDRVAIGAIHRLAESGLLPARDFSIVGFDNLDVSAYIRPTLSSIDQQIEAMMNTTVQLLKSSIEGHPNTNATHFISPLLIVRDSCRLG